MDKVKVFTIAQLPADLAQAWVQHLRDFDVAHPECHFEVALEAPDIKLADAIRALQIDPSLTFTQIYRRKKKGPRRAL